MPHAPAAVTPFEYRIVARNSAASSANVIHADAGAKAMGFKAALVPGNALCCYLESAVRGSLGPGWTERGAAEVRFTAPVYAGDQLTATACPADGAPADGDPVPGAVDVCAGTATTSSTWPTSARAARSS